MDRRQLYEPINEYKPFGSHIGIVDGPAEYLAIAGITLPLPFTTRMTVVRLATGELLLHSPIAFDTVLAKALSSLGTIRHLVSPNQFHYAHIGEWSRAFPGALTWASPHVRGRARARRIDVQFERDLSRAQAPDAWKHEIDQTFIPGGIFGEFAFFHRESRTVILTDTIINFELEKLVQPWRFATRMTGMYYPHGQMFFGMRLPLFLQKRKAKAAVERILSWQPERIIISHGRCFESGAGEVLRRIFGALL